MSARGLSLLLLLGFGLTGFGLVGCGPPPPPASDYRWSLPPGVSPPPIPRDNPITTSKVELGRRLFYDKALSFNQTTSCASCHEQKRAFTDGKAQPTGATKEPHPRSAMSLANVGYRGVLTWANPLIRRLEQQALLPLFGETPIELGLTGSDKALYRALSEDPQYKRLFGEAFPEHRGAVNLETLVNALATFQRTLISRDAPYDRFKRGDEAALSAQARRGMKLFFSEKLSCFRCHGGADLNGPREADDTPAPTPAFHNTGLYNIGDKHLYPRGGQGLYELTGEATDMGKFRAPTLRNIAHTAPYMHDGSIESLQQVLDHYAAGGRQIATGDRAGDGRTHPQKSPLVKGFVLAPEEKAALLAFLRSLSDPGFLTNPAHADPLR